MIPVRRFPFTIHKSNKRNCCSVALLYTQTSICFGLRHMHEGLLMSESYKSMVPHQTP
jgi:hypothetical protein